MLRHSETGHEVEEEHHNDCVNLAEELKAHMEEHDYPEHQIDLVEGLLGELEEYQKDEDGEKEKEEEEPMDEREKNEDELDKYAEEEMEKHGVKPLAKITIGAKEKK